MNRRHLLLGAIGASAAAIASKALPEGPPEWRDAVPVKPLVPYAPNRIRPSDNLTASEVQLRIRESLRLQSEMMEQAHAHIAFASGVQWLKIGEQCHLPIYK